MVTAPACEAAAYPGPVPRDTPVQVEPGAGSTGSPLARAGNRSLWSATRCWTDLLVSLTIADLKVRYGRGGARLVKWIADPFALVGVYLVLVTLVLDRPGEAPGLSLACAVIPFQLVIAAVANSLGAVAVRRSIVLNMGFNRTLLPLSGTLTETVAFGASLLLLALMMAIYAVPPTLATLWLPVVIGVNLLLAVAFAYPASLLGVWMPDVRNFVTSAVRVLFFIAPGLVALSEVPGSAHDLLLINPLTGLFESYRDALLYGDAPGAFELLYPAGFALVLLAVFLPLYRVEQRQFAKIIEPG
jgi:lipopolysaccharide transport system permease protein